MIVYLIKSTLCLSAFLLVYYFLFEREKMHQFNRFYLLFALAFSLLIPFLTFEIYVESTAVAIQNNIQDSIPNTPISKEIIIEKTSYILLILWSIYALGTAILLFRFVNNLIKIRRKINTNVTEKTQTSILVLLNEKVLPHTFLNFIFINKDDYENKKIEGELFTHELTHVRQKHTLDILYIELLKTVFWFNPVFILYKKAIQLNHEFLADENVVDSYNNVPFYQNLLLQKASWNNTFYLASNLNYLVTKKRLIMMTKTTSSKTILLKKMLLLPVITVMIYFLCFETVAQQKNQTQKTNSETTKFSEDKKLDEYFAGVRFILYKNGYSTKTETIGKDLIFDKVYEDLTAEDKVTFKTWLKVPKATVKKSPTPKELEEFKNAKKFAIWIDGKNVLNSELNKYKAKEIAYFSGSVILKNARTKKHPQPFQYWFYTHPYFDKNQMGKQATKYGGDKVELFENFDKKIVTKKVAETISTEKKEVSNNPSEKEETAAKDKIYQEYLLEVEKTKDTDANDKIVRQYTDYDYTAVDKKPDFPGGMMKFYEFVGQNFKAPEEKINGKIYVKFIVEVDGSLSNFKILRDIGYGTGEEAVRVLKLSPKWIPAEQDGKKVAAEFSLPITIHGN